MLLSRSLLRAVIPFFVVIASTAGAGAASRYPWLAVAPSVAVTVSARIPPPSGFERVNAAAGTWAAWLRELPLKDEGAQVLLYTGAPKRRQDVHAAVLDIDVGTRDLQQCADAVMRLRAEWLWSAGRGSEIGFDNTNGKRMRWTGGTDYRAFRKYLDRVYAYAGTYSLARELKPVSIENIEIGDVFIKGGFPGHAVLVADMVENAASGERRFLLVQSYMPAQEIHVLFDPSSTDRSPWYAASFSGDLRTPEWTFARDSLRRFPKS